MTSVTILSHGFQAEYEAGWVNGLARNGVQVTLLGSDTTLTTRLQPGVRFCNVRGSQEPGRARWRKALNMLRYFATYAICVASRRRSAVHVIGIFSTRNAWVSVVEAWMTRWLSGGYILTVHNVLPHDEHTRLNRWLWGLIYRSADELIVHSTNLRRQLAEEFGIPFERICHVPHGCDRLLPFSVDGRMTIRTRFSISDRQRVVLFFGAIAPYKGLDLLLEAFSILGRDPAFTLLIAGRCRDGAYKSEIGRLIAQHPARAQIVWWDGYVPDGEVPTVFHAADVLALPYRHIDQSGVLFMAMATGTPVVATDVGGFREAIHDGVGIVVQANDPRALSEAMATYSGRRYDPRLYEDRLLWHRVLIPAIARYEEASR